MENNAAATNIPADEFRINEDGHLVAAIGPTYEAEARVEFGPRPGVITRIRRLAAEADGTAAARRNAGLFPRRPALG